jgi:glyceraldehyde 3-phosphate dehydrogenase
VTVRIAVNGFGRIGRTLARAIWSRPDLDLTVVAANDIQPLEQLAYLLEHDTIAGHLRTPVAVEADMLVAGGHRIRMLRGAAPEELPWADLGIDVVVESSRLFAVADQARRHLTVGAKRVVVSAPSDGADATIVVGVNDDTFDPRRHHVISNASCTTNCLAPMAKVLDENFGIDEGLMTTVHAYTSNQALVDGARGAFRDARAAATNIIPAASGAARATRHVLPHLAGRLDGSALRVPVPDGSITDLTVNLSQTATADDIIAAFRDAAVGPLQGIVAYSDQPIVSADVIGNPASCVFDAPLTATSGRLAKVFGWYDNEWGYSNRLAELLAIVGPSAKDAA